VSLVQDDENQIQDKLQRIHEEANYPRAHLLVDLGLVLSSELEVAAVGTRHVRHLLKQPFWVKDGYLCIYDQDK
jgi:hypothetical protein